MTTACNTYVLGQSDLFWRTEFRQNTRARNLYSKAEPPVPFLSVSWTKTKTTLKEEYHSQVIKAKVPYFSKKKLSCFLIWTQVKKDLQLHSLSFIRNAYKERFSWLFKFFERIRNRLVIFLKFKEHTSWKISEKGGLPSKN